MFFFSKKSFFSLSKKKAKQPRHAKKILRFGKKKRIETSPSPSFPAKKNGAYTQNAQKPNKVFHTATTRRKKNSATTSSSLVSPFGYT